MSDIVFVALTLELNAKLWTNDRPVKEAILQDGSIELFNPLIGIRLLLLFSFNPSTLISLFKSYLRQHVTINKRTTY